MPTTSMTAAYELASVMNPIRTSVSTRVQVRTRLMRPGSPMMSTARMPDATHGSHGDGLEPQLLGQQRVQDRRREDGDRHRPAVLAPRLRCVVRLVGHP